MLHLAQVQKETPEGKVVLKLLAQRKAEYCWTVLPEADHIQLSLSDIQLSLSDTCEESYSDGALVLVELSSTRQIITMQNAVPWVLDLIDKYLVNGITPAMLHEETERMEQWRQSLTLQSQDLGRRALEMEARREQIQELEEKLKQEKQQLEILAAKANANPG
jgi:hypothetical protein